MVKLEVEDNTLVPLVRIPLLSLQLSPELEYECDDVVINKKKYFLKEKKKKFKGK